jgi:hypothetical protein
VWPKHANVNEAFMTIKEPSKKAKKESAREQEYQKPKREGKKANTELLNSECLKHYLVADSLIGNLIGSLTPDDMNPTAIRFQAIADLTQKLLDDQIDRPEASELEFVKELAGESSNKHYRRLMKIILAAIKEGRDGINAAHLTADQTVRSIFYWMPECMAALNQYKARLRRMREAA